MSIQNNIIIKVLLILLLGLLSACGSDDGLDAALVTGRFIDDPVQGLNYQCSSGIEGKTNINGEYSCNVNDEVTFILGNKTIGTVKAQSAIHTPYSFFPNNLNAALNLARFLQAVDIDKDPSNGVIVIDSNLLLTEQTDFLSSSFNKDVQKLYSIKLVTGKEAQDRLHKGILSAGGVVPEGVNVAETTPPVITLIGDDTIRLIKGDEYKELGATAVDDTSENIEVEVINTVDSSSAGVYVNTYNAEDSFGNKSSVTRTIHVINEIIIKSAPTISGKSIAKFLGADNEVISAGNESLILSSNVSNFLVLALNDEDTLEYLGITNASESETKLDEKSTALSLLVLFPNITLAYNTMPEIVKNIIEQNAEVLLFSEAISNTPLWSDMVNPILLQTYSNAVVSVLTQLNLIGQKNTDIQARAFSLAPSDDESVKSGVKLSVGGTVDDKLTFTLENNFSRWVVGTAGVDENISELVILGPKQKSNTLSYDSMKIPEEGLVISALGPGLGVETKYLPNGTYSYFLTATIYSLLQEVVAPTIGVITGSGSCVKSIFDPTSMTQGVLDSFLISTEIEDSIKNSAYSEAGLQTVMLGLEHIQGSAVGCLTSGIAKEIAKYMIPVLGGAEDLMKSAELTVKLAPFGYAWVNSHKYEYWTIENSLNSDFEMVGVDFLPANLMPFGSWNYTKSADINSSFQGKYNGDCIKGDDTVCEGYTFDSEGPYKMSFTLSCEKPDDNTNIPCKKVIFTPENLFQSKVFQAGSDGLINFTHEYAAAQEYKGFIEVVDTDNAVNQYNFNVQIKKAEPQLVIRYEGKELPYAIQNNEWKNSSPFKIICCEDGKNSVTETFELFNKGTSEAEINIFGSNLGDGDFKASSPKELSISPGEGVTFDVTYTKDDVTNPTGKFKIIGDLGGQSVSKEDKKEEYISMMLDLKVVESNFHWSGRYNITAISADSYYRSAYRNLTGQTFSTSAGIKFAENVESNNLRLDLTFGGNAGYSAGCEGHTVSPNGQFSLDLNIRVSAKMNFVTETETETKKTGTFTASNDSGDQMSGTWSVAKTKGLFGKCLEPSEGTVCKDSLISEAPHCLIACSESSTDQECVWSEN